MTDILIMAALLFAGLFLIGWGLSGKKRPEFTKKETEKY